MAVYSDKRIKWSAPPPQALILRTGRDVSRLPLNAKLAPTSHHSVETMGQLNQLHPPKQTTVRTGYTSGYNFFFI
ncbi:hypothetical protein C0J52_10930 [Blattella germanica]|nr:hypothetical protein C0J52_10930 [Blattella germanica]